MLKFAVYIEENYVGDDDFIELKKLIDALEEFVQQYDYDPSRFDFTFDDGIVSWINRLNI